MLFGERAYWPRLFSSRQPLAAALGHVGGESSARRGGRAPLNTPEPDDGLDATDGLRLYIIGDIHGCSDLLDRVADAISRDLARHPAIESLTITLGDYVDRGLDSRGVLDRLARNPFPTRYVALRGNHEELFGSFLDDPSVGAQWRHLGGAETLHSYGIPVRAFMLGKELERSAESLRDAIPQEHLDFVTSLPLCLSIGDYFFCHAGVRPAVPLDRQQAQDLLWIRNEFLNSNSDFGKIVVHGHTPIEQPEILPNRINIDTGAFATGRLTCLVLEGGHRRFLSSA
jgi:serine/threonine protein phosphatase 1